MKDYVIAIDYVVNKNHSRLDESALEGAKPLKDDVKVKWRKI